MEAAFQSGEVQVHIGYSHDTKYYMKGGDNRVVVQSVCEKKDLGVYFTSNLKPEKHFLKSAAKERSILAMVRRNFSRMDEGSFCLLYKTNIIRCASDSFMTFCTLIYIYLHLHFTFTFTSDLI